MLPGERIKGGQRYCWSGRLEQEKEGESDRREG